MKYQIRAGVVLKKVAGEYLLLATMEASQYCPYVYQVNETAAFFWYLLERQLVEDEMVTEIAAEYEVPEEAARQDLRKFIQALHQQGYLIQEENV